LKEPLRKILGKALLTYTEMYTVLTDIEAVINSRPLTFIGDEINDGQVITPAHLALGRSLKAIPDATVGSSTIAPVSSRFLYRQNLANRFWRRWMTEYSPQLTIRQILLEEKPPLRVGDIVLMSEDNVKRGNWPLAIVKEIHKGKRRPHSHSHITDQVGAKATVGTKVIFIGRGAQRRGRPEK
jgi:hypothetical protein